MSRSVVEEMHERQQRMRNFVSEGVQFLEALNLGDRFSKWQAQRYINKNKKLLRNAHATLTSMDDTRLIFRIKEYFAAERSKLLQELENPQSSCQRTQGSEKEEEEEEARRTGLINRQLISLEMEEEEILDESVELIDKIHKTVCTDVQHALRERVGSAYNLDLTEPTTDEPTTDEPTTDESTTDESSTDDSSTDDSTTDDPTTDDPTTDDSTTDEPTNEEPKP